VGSLYQGNLKGGETEWCLKKKIGKIGKKKTKRKKTGKHSLTGHQVPKRAASWMLKKGKTE
jgi:hypothetical protein